ncbi:MAG: ribosome-recycling factor, partial [Pseudomonadales bacterium]
MLDDIKSDAEERMGKSIQALMAAFAKIRTGRAHPGILDGISVDYYGVDTPLNQVANVSVEDARTLTVSPWEKPMVPVAAFGLRRIPAPRPRRAPPSPQGRRRARSRSGRA